MIEVRIGARAGVGARWVQNIIRQVFRAEREENVSAGIYLANDREIRRINKRFLNHDYATDVISFDLDGAADIVVSVETARRVSRQLGIPFREELARYLVHGVLHYLGYRDKKPAERKRMFRRQEFILKKIT